RMTEIQSEIKSLKNLLLNRRSFPPIPTNTSPIPTSLAYQSTSSNSSNSPPKNNTTLVDADDSGIDSFLGRFSSGKSAIPAWQLADSSPVSNEAASYVSAVKKSPVVAAGYTVQGSDGEEEITVGGDE
ncbi:hypothetical protein HK100_006845, partial [Physocladia obscura]